MLILKPVGKIPEVLVRAFGALILLVSELGCWSPSSANWGHDVLAVEAQTHGEETQRTPRARESRSVALAVS